MNLNLATKTMLMALALPLLFGAPALAQSAEQLEENRRVAMEFFRSGITAQERYDLVHPDYIQHNPLFKVRRRARPFLQGGLPAAHDRAHGWGWRRFW